MSEAKGVVSIVDVAAYAEFGVPWTPADTRGLVQQDVPAEAAGVRRSVSANDYTHAQQEGWPETSHLIGPTPDYDNEPHGLPYDHPEFRSRTALTLGLLAAGVTAATILLGNIIGAFPDDKPRHSPVNRQPGIEVPANQNGPNGVRLP